MWVTDLARATEMLMDTFGYNIIIRQITPVSDGLVFIIGNNTRVFWKREDNTLRKVG